MEFDDEQLPNESSISNMQRSYAGNVGILSTQEKTDKLQKLDWQTNTKILSQMAAHAPNNTIRSYIRGLIELNKADEEQILSLFKESLPRKNPVLPPNGNFNQLFRLFIQNETQLIGELIQISLDSNKETSESIGLILLRRLEALSVLSNFQTNGIFI